MIPAEQCISNGFSCIQSAYPTPTDAVRIEAEDRFKGGDRAPYYIMDRRASLKHLKVGEVNSNIKIVEDLLFVQWNLDLTKSLGTGQICSLNGGFVISKTSI